MWSFEIFPENKYHFQTEILYYEEIISVKDTVKGFLGTIHQLNGSFPSDLIEDSECN